MPHHPSGQKKIIGFLCKRISGARRVHAERLENERPARARRDISDDGRKQIVDPVTLDRVGPGGGILDETETKRHLLQPASDPWQILDLNTFDVRAFSRIVFLKIKCQNVNLVSARGKPAGKGVNLFWGAAELKCRIVVGRSKKNPHFILDLIEE